LRQDRFMALSCR